MSIVSSVLGGMFGGSGHEDPRKFSSGPINTGPQPLPVGGASGTPTNGFNSAQQQQFENAFHSDIDLSGIWDKVKGLGGDAWGTIQKLLPKNADGSIDWGAIGTDVVKWVKDNKSTIIDGLNAYNQYNRQQQSDKYAKDAIDLAKQSYAAKQPLRDAGMAGMLDPHAGTPDLSALKTQGQSGLGIQAPLPVAAPNTNFQNAQKIAGPGSGNPFAQPTPLPVAPPISSMPGQPSQPGQPIGRPLTPSRPTPLPVGGPVSPLAPMAPAAPPMGGNPLPVAASGPLVPQDKRFTPGITPGIMPRRPMLPASPLDPNNPNNPQPIPVSGMVGY